MTKKQYQLNRLSDHFYNRYPSTLFPEIEYKPTRPYIVLLIQMDGCTFALPFRTNIRHRNCYSFQYSSRKTESVTEIDFSKAIVITNEEDIGDAVNIDDKEYVELNDRIGYIINRFRTYLNGYRKYVAGSLNPYQAKNYRYTTLRYFHNELGLAQNMPEESTDL